MTNEDIGKEIRAITDICKPDVHRNIINILRHGSLKLSDYDYVDMELCVLNLVDYLGNFDRSIVLSNEEAIQMCRPVFIQRELEGKEEQANIWIIMSHMALGLEFLHNQKYAHRDLKPNNGNPYFALTH